MPKRSRCSVAAVATAAALALVLTGQAGAQTPPAPTTTAPNLLEGLVRQLLPTTPPPPAPTTTAPAAAGAAPGAVPKANATPAPTATTTTTPPGVIPPEFIPIINSVVRTGGRTTKPLMDALRPMQQELGLTAQEAALAGFGHFPVAGDASYNDDWLEPRFGPPFHLHQGTDIFAARGTPVRAPFAGVVRFEDGGLGGKGAYVTTPDGTFYYMAHLDAFAPKLGNGSAVKQGDVVGFTGDTGNAQGGATHVHFEIHPRGGAAVDPKPILDGWINEAVNNAAALLAANNVGISRAITGAGVLRRFDGQSSAEAGQAVGPLLWASSVSAGGGTIRLAQLQMARMVGRIDWKSRTTAAQAQADALREGQQVARTILAPLTPKLLAPVLGNAS